MKWVRTLALSQFNEIVIIYRHLNIKHSVSVLASTKFISPKEHTQVIKEHEGAREQQVAHPWFSAMASIPLKLLHEVLCREILVIQQ